MNLNQRGANLIKRITTNKTSGCGTDIIFVNPDNSLTVTIPAQPTKHMLKNDENGFKSIARTASIAVSESVLVAAGYPTRNADSEVALIQHKVTWTDVSGLTWTYTVRNTRPDETLGLIILILDDYEVPVTPEKIIIRYEPGVIRVNIVAEPNPGTTQTLDNGDIIPLEYALNEDGTFTIPYLQGTPKKNVLIPFMVGNDSYQQNFDNDGVFTFTFGTIVPSDEIAINAAIPIYNI